ncbi:MAG: DUF3667 domain-containing protein [Bacteroidales bacterium]|nr:DUF3667 domain-containing protein [Bacteroidales bacterium]
MNITAWYQRFRSWQRDPRQWPHESMGEHCCANCEHTYIGNYCPVCGQSAKEGRVDWLSLHRIVMMVWGLDSRSMLYSLWQLIWRPGYMVGEYINGRRQVSFPPVKMLFIMALFYAIVMQLSGMNQEVVVEQTQEQNTVLDAFLDWLRDHPAWSMLSLTMSMVLPTWALFRFSPFHHRHTLPEGITIQLFMSTLLLLILFVNKFASGWLSFLAVVYYYVCYRQLFGYRFWGTLWRTLTCFFTSFLMIIIVYVMIALIFDVEGIGNEAGMVVIAYVAVFVVLMLFLAAILVVGAMIGRRTYRKRSNQSLTK